VFSCDNSAFRLETLKLSTIIYEYLIASPHRPLLPYTDLLTVFKTRETRLILIHIPNLKTRVKDTSKILKYINAQSTILLLMSVFQ
jgi:hypothetical protein